MIFVFHISLQAGMQVNIITSKLIVRILFFKNYEIRQDFYSRPGYHQVANKGMAPLYFTVSGLLPPVCSFKAEARERGRQPMHYDYCMALPTSSSLSGSNSPKKYNLGMLNPLPRRLKSLS